MQIWTGTVTVGAINIAGITLGHGFSVSDSVGALDDTTFSVGSNNYVIDAALKFVSAGKLRFSLASDLSTTDRAQLTLHVCDDSFAFSAATLETLSTYDWSTSIDDWSSETTRTLYLSVPSDTTLSTDATLSALALSGGTLAPTFVSTTETYTATVGNSVTATTVTATPTHSGATVAFKDGDDNALTNPVTLVVGDNNVIRAVVTAEDTTTMKTYMVTVTRADTITTPPEIVPGGVQVTSTPMATADTYGLGETIEITVTFDKAVTVDTSGGRPRIRFHLDGGVRKWAGYSSGSGGTALEFTYTVQADDMDDDGIWLPANVLQLEGGTISAAADNTVDAILTYTSPGVQTEHKVDGSLTRNPRPAIVTDGVQVTSMPMATADTYGLGETIEITVTFDKAVTVDTSGGTPRIAFRVDGDLLRWAEYSSASEGTALVFTYTVQAGDMDVDGIRLGANSIEPFGGTIRDATDPIVDATLTYARPGLQSGHKVDGSLTTADATLSALALSGVTLDPTFVSSTETYTATVVNGVTETTVTATPTQSGATVAFKDGDDNALTNPVTLAVGATVIKAVVTAQDGTTTKTYMVTVARPPKIVTVQVTSTPMATGDTYGRGETIAITVTFDNAVTVDTSGGTPRIAFHLDGGLRWAVYSSGSGDTALVFTYTVLADDRAVNGILLRGDQFDLFGGTIRDATDPIVAATLTYADPGLQSGHKVDGSFTTADATLSALALSGVTLVPTFVSSTETYTATVGNSVTETTVTATPTQSGATVAFKDGADNALTNPVTLAVGATVIKAVVTAQDGTTTKTYTVFIDVSDVDEPPTEPDAPTGLSATVSDQEVDLIWTAPASNGGATILRYEYEQDGSGTWISTGGTATSYTVTGLTNGQTYTFRVRAVNRVGAGLASSSRSATPTSTVVAPDTPSSFSATPGNRQVMLSWVQPSGGAALTDYEYEQDGSGTWTSTGGKAPSHTVTGLTNGQSYTFRVRAVNSAGASAASGSRTATPTTTAPEAPESLSFTPGDQQVTLRWRAPTNDGGEPITHYEYEQDGSGTWISTGGTATSHTVTGLNNGQTYMFRVRAVNALGSGAVVTRDATPSPSTGGGGGGGGGGGPRQTVPDAPMNLVAEATDAAVTLTWDAPEDDDGSAITDYEYRIDGRGSWISIGSTQTTHTVTGLVNGTAYVFEVRAVNRIGGSFASNRVEATPEAPEVEVFTLDFAHFANGTSITSDLVLVNVAPQPVRPAIYFYDQQGDLIAPDSLVDLTGDLEITEDGSLSVSTEMDPLGVLTISTHGRGELVSGSVKVVSEGLSIGGGLRYNLPAIGEAVVGAGPPVGDALFPVRRQEGGITTGVAIHNLGEEAMEARCELMREGVLRDFVSISLEANGQTSWVIDQAFPAADTSDFTGSVRCAAPGRGRFTAIAVEMDAAERIFTTLSVVPVERTGGGNKQTTLNFAHFVNGTWITDLVFVNLSTEASRPAPTPFHTAIPPSRPAIYFYDTEGNPIAAESVVDITGDLEITEDGALTVQTEMEPLGVLTISTHGRGELVSGSVRVVSEGPIGGMLRFGHPALGVAGVGASPPLSDALFPVRRQEGGITTGVALHNLESSPGLLRCDLMREGVLLDVASIPLEANGQTSWLIEGAFPSADTSDFAGSVRCDAVGEGLFSAVALEMDPGNRIFTTLPVVPVPRR